MGYTDKEIIKRATKALKDIRTFYQQPFVNYKGRTNDTKILYTELIAGFLIANIKKFDEINSINRPTYIVQEHNGHINNPGSRRREEVLAKSLFNREFKDTGKIIDYQIPLRERATDHGIKAIDLLSKNENELIIYEFKKADSTETLLRCLLEIETYYHILNRKTLSQDYFKNNTTNVRKAVLIFADGVQLKWYHDNQPMVKKLQNMLEIDIYIAHGDNDKIINITKYKE